MPCRLINPSKSEMGRVAKEHLEKIVNDITTITKANQWKNTSVVVNWLKSIGCNSRSRLLKFDIVEFYPSISENLLDNSLLYARGLTSITDDMISIIKHSRKSLLFDGNDLWIKNRCDSMFDVSMGSYDGAEVCELVGFYLLDKLSPLIVRENAGLYRDDGLAVVKNSNGPKLDRLRTDIIAIFKNGGLSITI